MWFTRLYGKFRSLIHEMGKFGLVGGVAYVIDTGIFALLLVTMESLAAKTIATVVAATVAFAGNRFWTWRHRARSGLTREYVLYFTFNGIGLAISLAILGVSHYGLGAIWPAFQTPLADLIAANVIGLVAGTIFRFWSYRTFVFRESPAEPATPATQPEEATEAAAGTEPETADGRGRDDASRATSLRRATQSRRSGVA